MKKLILVIATLTITFSLPVVAAAYTCPGGGPPPCPLGNPVPGGAGDVLDVMDRVTNWMFTGFLALAVILVILAAYEYLLAQGGAEEISKAHKMLIYAAIAIGVAVLAKGIVNAARKIAQGNNETSSVSSGTNGGTTSGNTAAGNTASGPGSPHEYTSTVSVYPCSDGTIPAVQVDGNTYGTVGGTMATINDSSPTVKVQLCSGTTIPPYVLVSGQRYPKPSSSGNTEGTE